MKKDEITLETSLNWLDTFIRRKTFDRLLGAGCLFLAGCVLVVVVWNIEFGLRGWVEPWIGRRDWIFAILASFVILLLFRRASKTNAGDWNGHSVSGGAAFDNPSTGIASAISRGLSINPMAPSTVVAFAAATVDILAFGPRLILEGLRAIRKCAALRQIDKEGCAAVLTVLTIEGKSLSCSEIAESIDGLDPADVFPQMPGIDGVIALTRAPAGLSLSGDLRATLNKSGATSLSPKN